MQEGLETGQKTYIIISMAKISFFVFKYNLKSQKEVYFLLGHLVVLLILCCIFIPPSLSGQFFQSHSTLHNGLLLLFRGDSLMFSAVNQTILLWRKFSCWRSVFWDILPIRPVSARLKRLIFSASPSIRKHFAVIRQNEFYMRKFQNILLN